MSPSCGAELCSRRTDSWARQQLARASRRTQLPSSSAVQVSPAYPWFTTVPTLIVLPRAQGHRGDAEHPHRLERHRLQLIRLDLRRIERTVSCFCCISAALADPRRLRSLSGEGKDFIAFFRKGQLQEVKWAGNPYANKRQGADYNPLEPRQSFKVWSEKVVGICRAWTDEQRETAGTLALVYGRFISVWREKEDALRQSRLKTLLLQNASHQVRAPLTQIIE